MEDKAWLKGEPYRDNDKRVIVVAGESEYLKIYKNANTTTRKLAFGLLASAAMDNKGELLAAIKYSDIESYEVTFPKANTGDVFIRKNDGKEFFIYGLIDYNARIIENLIISGMQPCETESYGKQEVLRPKAIKPVGSLGEQIPQNNKTPIMFCRKCGAKLVEGGLFCSRCGTKIVSD